MSDFNMQDMLTEMATVMPGVRLITVIDMDSMVLAAWQSPDNSLSPEGLGSFIQRINGTINGFKESSTGFSRLSNIILNTPSGYVILKPIYNGTCYIVVDAPSTVPMSIIRVACNNYAPILEQTMPGYQAVPLGDNMPAIVPQS